MSGRVVITGGGRLSDKRYKWLQTQCDQIETVLTICFQPSKLNLWTSITCKLFCNATRTVLSIENSDGLAQTLAKLQSFEAVFLTGGYPDRGLKALNQYASHLSRFVNQGGYVLGTSAGALVLSETCYISADEDYPNTTIQPGLGVINGCIEVHWEENKPLPKVATRPLFLLPEYGGVQINETYTTQGATVKHDN